MIILISTILAVGDNLHTIIHTVMTKKFHEYAALLKGANDEKHMKMAIEEATKAAQKGDMPIGAILVTPSHIIRECNTVSDELDVTAHAVMNIVRKSALFKHHLAECSVLYATVEPCVMCAKAAQLVGIKEIVFGCYDEVHGYLSSGVLKEDVNFDIISRGGFMAAECMKLFDKDQAKGLKVK